MRKIKQMVKYYEQHGTRNISKRALQRFNERVLRIYDRQFRKQECRIEELNEQRKKQPKIGLISIIIPIYNTEPYMLNELLQSLRHQSYSKFEVVLYDGGSTSLTTLAVLDEISRIDSRFHVIHGKKNLGISGNTNEAIESAHGEYCALCDHDDILSLDALWRIAVCIENESPDLIYTDEDKITNNGRLHVYPHYKPDYCPDTLISDNYFCHLCVIRKALLVEIGGLRSEFDGSQDHDLFIRIAEKTKRIVHLPYTLYSWRENSKSMSHLNMQKCLESSCKAIVEHEARMGRMVSAVPMGKVIRLRYKVDLSCPLEVIIWGETRSECQKCLEEILILHECNNLGSTFVVCQGSEKWRGINKAIKESEASYILIINAKVHGMNSDFIKELLMYAQQDGIAAVTPLLSDRKHRITHGGYAIGMKGIAQCVNERMFMKAGGWHDIMNKVHNVSAISICCCMIKKSDWIGLTEDYHSCLVSIDWSMKVIKAGKRLVYTPHATAIRERTPLLLNGMKRDKEDVERFEKQWGTAIYDPCYSSRFSKQKANYSLNP